MWGGSKELPAPRGARCAEQPCGGGALWGAQALRDGMGEGDVGLGGHFGAHRGGHALSCTYEGCWQGHAQCTHAGVCSGELGGTKQGTCEWCRCAQSWCTMVHTCTAHTYVCMQPVVLPCVQPPQMHAAPEHANSTVCMCIFMCTHGVQTCALHLCIYRAACVQSCRRAQDVPALRFTCMHVPLLCMHPDSHALPGVHTEHLGTVHTCTLACMCLCAGMHSLHTQGYMPAQDCMPGGHFWDAAEVLPGAF